MNKTNSKQVKETVREYILNCLEITPTEFYNQFKSEFCYPQNIRLYPNVCNRFVEYLKGLPSNFSIAFMDYEIEKLVNSWTENKKEYDAIKTNKLFYHLISREFFYLLQQEINKNKEVL